VGKPRRSARRASPAGGIARATGRWRAIAARDRQEPSAGIVRWGVPGSRKRSKGIRGWLRRHRDELIRDGLIGLVVLAVGFGVAAWWDSRLAERQNQLASDIAINQDRAARDLATANEIQENVRFVRQVVIDNAAEKPFRALNLSGASLGSLDLACEDFKHYPPTGCADLILADLRGANLRFADLRGADLRFADLTSANLSFADLTDANLTSANLSFADLTGADLTLANLNLANLTGANLRGADLRGDGLLAYTGRTGMCYDGTTVWPDGFTPPSPYCPERRSGAR
jgi:hypothetical protein